KESNNLCKLNSYKHSGLAYKKTMTIQVADKEQGVVLGTTKTKKQNKLKLYFWFRNCDEKTNTVISKGLRVTKSHPKKRNMQA
ncbi:hypothetical protein Bca52824_032669, partial [Brassica carinata]